MKKSSGIALITLIITVVMLSILVGAGIELGLDSLNVKKINNLYTDIKSLNDSVTTYYNQYGALPIKEKFTGNYAFETSKNPNDDPDSYYVIDINKLGYISLTNNVKWIENDVYIINLKTHMIYYPEGIKYENEMYYRLPGEYSIIEP